MIDFASITKTLDGYDCHYFGQRSAFVVGIEHHVHCFGVFHPQMGVFEKLYDDQGHKLSMVCGRLVRSNSQNFRIVEASDE